MQYDDDIAFQRAILANPADTTLKLVYADWLQERADPRAEYIRLQLELLPWKGIDIPPEWDARREPLNKLEPLLDPFWVGFVWSLAQPFQPGMCSASDPFTERVGMRGEVSVFESQYRTAHVLSDGLLADLAFLASVR